jgi:hypothetical protein
VIIKGQPSAVKIAKREIQALLLAEVTVSLLVPACARPQLIVSERVVLIVRAKMGLI